MFRRGTDAPDLLELSTENCDQIRTNHTGSSVGTRKAIGYLESLKIYKNLFHNFYELL